MVSNMHVDTTRHFLYAAIYHYRSGMFRTVLRLLDTAKLNLQHPQLLYPWTISTASYRAAGGDHKPFNQMMTEIVAWPIELAQDISIPELALEHHCAAQIWTDYIVIPPLVMVQFLFFLCRYHMQDFQISALILHYLHSLLHYDDGYHIAITEKAISWQMLGICQEMSGDYHGAYQSYSNALQQKWCPIKLSSIMRIQNLRR